VDVQRIDVLQDDRLRLVLELIELASKASKPTEVFEIFGPRLWRLRPLDYFLTLSVRNLEPGQYKITRELDVEKVRDGDLSATRDLDPWSNWKTIPAHTGGLIGQLIDGPSPKMFVNLSVSGDPVLGNRISHMGSVLAYPVLEAGKALNWTVVFRRDPAGFTPRDIEETVLQGNLIGAMTRSLVAIRAASEANKRLMAQFEEVARVQQSLLPPRTPKITGLEIASSYLASEQAGGDYYDFIRLPNQPGEPPERERWGILMADVSGHGAAAATVMAMLHGILHCYNGPDFHPDAVLRYANEKLLGAQLEGSFVTAFFGVYDPDHATLDFACAGHPAARLRRARDGSIVVLEGSRTFPVGILPELEEGSTCLKLEPGDTVILFTDGITEAMNETRELFGERRLDDSLRHCDGSPDCAIDSIHHALFDFTKSRTRADDQTLVAIRYTGAPRGA
jgi:phosphoserine phosphatase RsbU/P